MTARFLIAGTALAVAALMSNSRTAAAGIPEPAQDPFYQPPAGFETKAPGSVLKTRTVVVQQLGLPLPVRAWQVLARSTDAKDQPVAVVATLMVPWTPWWFGKRPLVSYQAAIDSLGDQCNPSFTLRASFEKELPLIEAALLKGWAVVTTDYQGPQNAFGAGRMAGHAVLDGIRAAQRVAGSGLGSNTPVGMWGYSGGALATTWAAELQPAYAPELDIVGVASGGVPSDLAAASRLVDGGFASGLELLAVTGLSRQYPELLPVFNANGLAMRDAIGDQCLITSALLFPFRRLSEFTNSPDPLNEPVALAVLADNRLGFEAPTAPIYIYHSIFDELIPYSTAVDLRASYCAQGAAVQFHTDVLSEHAILAVTGAPAAIAYLGARFSGKAIPNNCP